MHLSLGEETEFTPRQYKKGGIFSTDWLNWSNYSNRPFTPPDVKTIIKEREVKQYSGVVARRKCRTHVNSVASTKEGALWEATKDYHYLNYKYKIGIPLLPGSRLRLIVQILRRRCSPLINWSIKRRKFKSWKGGSKLAYKKQLTVQKASKFYNATGILIWKE